MGVTFHLKDVFILAKMSKREESALLMEGQSELFRCPICTSEIMVKGLSLVCEWNHSFDIAKQGYVNLLSGSHKTKYDKSLFEERRKLIQSGFYHPVTEKISELINEFSSSQYILDAGCGEGTHLNMVREELGTEVTTVGIDISKEGVLLAAKDYPDSIWNVGDLAACPYSDGRFDAIVNILSPANYSEFKRILNNDGVFIKVMPREGYLKELRKAVYRNSPKEVYEKEDTLDRFEEYFNILANVSVTYRVELDADQLHTLIRMSPLTWGLTEGQKEELASAGLHEITVDLQIVAGKKK